LVCVMYVVFFQRVDYLMYWFRALLTEKGRVIFQSRL